MTVTAGQDALTLYRWNMRTTRNYFCSVCGVYVFNNKRAAPDHFVVDMRCVEGLPTEGIPVQPTEGEGMSVSKDGAQAHWPGPRV